MLVEADIWTIARSEKGTAVLIRPQGSQRAVPIFIGQLEAQSILIGLGSVPMPRPLTHDLMLHVLNRFKIQVERVEINDFKDETFYARLILKEGENTIVLDARPSDAFGLAIRTKCPVYIAEFIVDEVSVPIELLMEKEQENEVEEEDFENFSTPEDFAEIEEILQYERKNLEHDLETAIKEENYEEAARLRDMLKDFDRGSSPH